MVDYLSTVSGGGYTGSALSSLLNDPDAGLEGKSFPLSFEKGSVEQPALRHLRSGANYLTGGGAMDVARLPAILVRGLLLNMVLILPYIMLAAIATIVAFPLVHESGTVRILFWITLAAFATVIGTYPLVTALYGRGRSWEKRNRAENLLTLTLVFFATAVVVSMLSDPVSQVLTSRWGHTKALFMSEVESPAGSEDILKWVLVVAVFYGAIRATKVAESVKKRSSQVFLYLLGMTAPAAAFGVYLLLLAMFARSPFLDVTNAQHLTDAAEEKYPPFIMDSTLLNDFQGNGLAIDGTSRVTVDSKGRDAAPNRWTVRAGALHEYRITKLGAMFKMGGVDFGRGTLRLAFPTGAINSMTALSLSDDLANLLDSLSEAKRDSAAKGKVIRAVISDSLQLARLHALGVPIDAATEVAYTDSGVYSWTLGPNRAGMTYRIDDEVDRGVFLRDADLGPVEELEKFLVDTAHHGADGPLATAMRRRGANLDGNVKVKFFTNDNSWIVRSGEVQEYVITREGGRGSRTVLSTKWPEWVHWLRAKWDARSGRTEYLHVHGIQFGSQTRDLLLVGTFLALFILNLLVMDVNMTSPHGYWRDRLSRVFLFRARWFGRPVPNDELKLSEMGTANPAVPYHLLNASLNLAASRVEDLPGRGSDFFIFSRRYVGSYSTGFCRSADMEAADKHINVGTAMAISSAAVAPNSGTVTVRPLVPMLTVLNVRQDYWAPNPWFVQAGSDVRKFLTRWLTPGPSYLWREAAGILHARGRFVNLSDGGHIENLGVYELLRRRCKVIVAVDAEHDPTMSCASLATLTRYARIDLGIEIDIETNPLNLDATGKTHRHWTLGTIRYDDSKDEKDLGYLLYVKSSYTGDEAPYVKDYRRANPDFPQQSTADQFFDEAQFESYRALGYHSTNGALKAASELDAGDGKHGTVEALAAVRNALTLDPSKLKPEQRFTGRTAKMD
jgi:hypothetical protein